MEQLLIAKWVLLFLLVIAIVLEADYKRCKVLCQDAQPDSFEIFPALIVFGDSTVDVGNNNYLRTILKADFNPYGRDFDTHQPTGRFCNGRLASDFIAIQIGLPYPGAYLDPQSTGPKLLKGVNFASSGSGWLDGTAKPFNVIGLGTQIDWFRKYKQEITGMVGPAKAQQILNGALYIVSTGANDYLNSYFLNPQLKRQYNYDQYQALALGSARQYLDELYSEGGRNIAVLSLPPLGCLPSQISLYDGDGSCIEEPHNRVARKFNAALELMIEEMKPSLHSSRLVYLDIYSYFYQVTQNPQAYGFRESARACCGSGYLEVAFLCNAASRGTCQDASEFVFFDSFHPTDRFYSQLGQKLFEDAAPILVGPAQP